MSDTTQVIETTEPTGWTHPLNIAHLVMGLVFLGAAAVWALVEYDAVAGDDITWLLPLPWVFGGAAGLLAMVLSARRRSVSG